MMRAVLLVCAMIAVLPPVGFTQQDRDFYGPTGHPYSGYVGGVDDELALLRLHFDLTEQQSELIAQVVKEHRGALKGMNQLMGALIRDHLQRVPVAGGVDDLYAEDPDAGAIVVEKRKQIMEAQQRLESQMVERIRVIAEPAPEAVWSDYLITRDFERWSQPSEYDSLGETFDPLVLFHHVAPKLAADPTFREALREKREEAHKAARQVLEAFQLAEEYSFSTRYRMIDHDGEHEHALYDQAADKAKELLGLLWKIPDTLFDDHAGSADARKYRVALLSKQSLHDSYDLIRPIEHAIRGSELIRMALELPDLTPEQRAPLSAQWQQITETYRRAEDVRMQWLDDRFREVPLDLDDAGSVLDYLDVLNEADVDLDALASVLTPPQWYIVLGNARAIRFRLDRGYERAIGFDWSTLDFEALIPE
jgi:hypothetical protein